MKTNQTDKAALDAYNIIKKYCEEHECSECVFSPGDNVIYINVYSLGKIHFLAKGIVGDK